jgi:trk system potassium uptake protein TrkH
MKSLRDISLLLSKFLYYLCFVISVPFFYAAYLQYIAKDHLQPHSTFAFACTLIACLTLALGLKLFGRKGSGHIYRRDGILLVVAIWLITCFIGALPFYLSHTLNPLNAYFEAMSGFTTTGATTLCPKIYDYDGSEVPHHITNHHTPDKTYTFYGTIPPVRDDHGMILFSGIEAVPRALLLWRSLMQWIGGLGIVVIFLSILPALQVGGKFLYQVEMTGPIKEGVSPRVKSTSSQLWMLYLFLTGLQVALLYSTNHEMPFFDALCVSLSTISTGGFSVRNQNLATYQSNITNWIVFIFMIAGSLNFSLYFQAIRLKFKKLYAPDLLLFLAVALVGCVAVSIPLIGQREVGLLDSGGIYSIGSAFKEGSFQAISLQTSTGFVTSDYDQWPFISQMFLLLLMFVGGMSGSTAGGIKTSRFYILFKIVQNRLESIYRPDSVRTLRIGAAEVDDKNAMTVLAFFCIVAFFVVIGTVSLVIDGIDPETSLGLIACFLNNVGTAFRAAGPTDSFAFLSPFSKILAIFWMLLGRLEYYVCLLLLLPSFWKNR